MHLQREGGLSGLLKLRRKAEEMGYLPEELFPDVIATAAYIMRVLDAFMLEYLKRTAKESFFFATN